MRILIINDYLTSFGWAEKAVMDQKTLLAKNGHDVYLLWGTKCYTSIFSYFRRYLSFKYYISTINCIKHNDIKVVHCHSISRNISPSPIVASKLLWKKTILTIHDFHFFCPKTWGILRNWTECEKWFNTKCFLLNCKTLKEWYKYIPYHFLKWLKVLLHRTVIKHCVDIYICPSKKLRERMIQSLMLPRHKVVHLPNSIKIDIGHTPDFTKINVRKFLFVWRISKEKWIDIAIKAFNKLVHCEWISEIFLEIAWEGPERENLENLVNELSLRKQVKFLGRIENSSLSKHYEESVWLIIPSVCLENNPLVGIEWMKYWKPLIWSNTWGIPDLVDDLWNGFLFKLWDYDQLAEKIKILYENKDMSVKMWEYGLRKLKQEYDSEQFYRRLLDIYE